MSQITSCPSCGTRFRVVTDQLRISDGWVRCGQCQEVFDATLSLEQVQDAPPAAAGEAPDAPAAAQADALAEASEPESAAASTPSPTSGYELPAPLWDEPPDPDGWLARAPGTADTEPTLTLSDMAEATGRQQWPELGLDWPQVEPQLIEASPAQAGELQGQVPVEAEPSSMEAPMPAVDAWPGEAAPEMLAPAAAAVDQDMPSRASPDTGTGACAEPEPEPEPEPDVARTDTSAAPEFEHKVTDDLQDQVPHPAETVQAPEAEPLPSGWATSELLPPGTEPGFVREARRKAWWQKPAVRLVMGALVVVLPCALLLQVALHERSTLVAWQPGWRPALEAMCTSLRCEITPRQDIEAVVVSGSSFSKDAQAQRFQLGLSIQNQSRLAVAVPAVELTLTDAQDQAIVRRVLQPQDLGAPRELAGRAEWSTTVPVQTEGLGLQVAGYRVLVFYP